MKKAILKISILFLAPILLTIPYTSSFFSSQAISKKSIFKAGNLSIKDQGQIISDKDFNNLYPGWQDNKTIKLHNDGTLNFKCKMSICCDEDSILYNGDNCLKVTIIEGNKFYCENKKINEVKDIVLGEMDSGASRTLKFKFSLPDKADNNYCGKPCNLRFVFDAVQENVPFVFNVHQGDSIQNAVNNSCDGDIINIASGTYTENLTIDKSLTLNGDGANRTILKNQFNNNGVISIDKPVCVNIKNLTISPEKNNGISISAIASNCNLDNVIFQNGNNGVSIGGSGSNVILNNCAFNKQSTSGIVVNISVDAKSVDIENCKFNDPLYYLLTLKNSLIKNLKLKNNEIISGKYCPYGRVDNLENN